MNEKRMNTLLKKETEKKRLALFESNHRGRKKGRKYVQLIDIEDGLTRKTRRAKQ